MTDANYISQDNTGAVSGGYVSYGYGTTTADSVVAKEPATLTVPEQLKQVRAELASRTFFKRYFGPHPIETHPPYGVLILLRQFLRNIGPVMQGAVILYVYMYAYRNNPVIPVEMQQGNMFLVGGMILHVLNTFSANNLFPWRYTAKGSLRWLLLFVQVLPIFLYVLYITLLLTDLAKNVLLYIHITADIAIVLSLGLFERVLTCVLLLYARFWVARKLYIKMHERDIFLDVSPYELPGNQTNEARTSRIVSAAEQKNRPSQITPRMPATMPPVTGNNNITQRRTEIPMADTPPEPEMAPFDTTDNTGDTAKPYGYVYQNVKL